MAQGRRRVQGYAVTSYDCGRIVEQDTITCGHCQTVVFIPPKPAVPPGGWCGRCSASICDKCVDDGRCTPFEARLEAVERADARGRYLLRLLAGDLK